MKKTLFYSIALLATLTFAASCHKEPKQPIITSSQSEDLKHKNLMTHAKEINEFTLADMQTYSEDGQRMIFAELTPENKARLVKERLEYAINQETDQKIIDFLRTGESMVSASLYLPDRDAAATQTVAAIQSLVEANMAYVGYDKMKSLGTTWGTTGTADLPIDGGTRTIGGGTPTGPVTGMKDCHCASESSFCLPGYKCDNWASCGHMDRDCGWWWQYTCDGLCV